MYQHRHISYMHNDVRGIPGNIMVLSDFLGSLVVLCQLRGWKNSVKKLRVRVRLNVPPQYKLPVQTVLFFVFVLFCFVLFCFVLFCFVLCFVLFCFVFSLIYLHLSCQQVGLRLIYPRDEPSDRCAMHLGESPCPTSMLEALIAEGRLGVVWTEQLCQLRKVGIR